jgi:uronate dehydrogenase
MPPGHALARIRSYSTCVLVVPDKVQKVLITGAAGLAGSILWSGLDKHYSLVGIDTRRVRDRDVRRGDLTRIRSVQSAFQGVDAVIDLAATADQEAPWRQIWKNNVRATMNALEAALQHGVRRYVFASSSHVTGMYEHEPPYSAIVAGEYEGLDPDSIPLISAASPVRPDSPYAIGKALGEAAARYYSDTFGLSAVCLRIGTIRPQDRPTRIRHFATLLSHADLVQLVDCALRAPDDVRFAVYYGVSDNCWRFWDIADARTAIGYIPQDDAERFRTSSGDPSDD